MRGFLLAAFVAIASASPALLGSNKCTYGPSYWCSHVEHARQCGAMTHCMTNVWTNTLPVKSDAGCEVCVFGITEARKLLKDHATEAQITEFLEKGCAMVPEETLRTECENIVKKYLPEILQLLASDLDPKAVCAAIGMCTAQLDQSEGNAVSVTTAAPGDLCTDCEKFMTDLENMLKDNQTLAMLEATLDVMCARLGPLENECKQLIAQYLPILLDALASEFNPGVTCRILGLCNSGNVKDALDFRVKLLALVKQIPMTNNIEGPEECSICKMVMTELQSLDRNAKTQETIENFLEQNLCSLFGPLKTQCQELIKDYAPMLFEYLANELDPEVACKAFHLCTSSRTARPENRITSLTVVKSDPILIFKTKPVKQNQPQRPVKASLRCIICEFILKELDTMLMKNSSKAEVTKALEAVCSRLPKSIAAECKAFVDQYAAVVIELLVARLDPTKVCEAIGLCSRSGAVSVPVNDGVCEVCKLVIQYLDSLLKENATEEEIIQLLEKICNFLPSELKKQCDSLIATYGKAIVQLLAEMADPLKVCSALKLCPNATTAHQALQKMDQLVGAAQGYNTLYYQNSGLQMACLRGPAVWCKDAVTANKCGLHAVAYCRRHVWER